MKQKRMQLYESLKSIFLHIDNHEKAFLSTYGLNIPRFYVLMHVNNHHGLNYMELSDLLLCTKSNTSRIVQGMQKDGLLSRVSNPEDGRSYHLYLTEEGQNIFEKVYPAYTELVNGLMSKFSNEEISRYHQFSQTIENTLAPQPISQQPGQPIQLRDKK